MSAYPSMAAVGHALDRRGLPRDIDGILFLAGMSDVKPHQHLRMFGSWKSYVWVTGTNTYLEF